MRDRRDEPPSDPGASRPDASAFPEGPGPGGPRSGPAPTIRLGGRDHDRGPGLLAGAIVLFLALAWVKPWPPPPPPLAPLAPPPTARPPEPTADPLSSLKYHCQEPSGWRVYDRERWAGLALRSWRTLEPARAASGPLDPGIPVVPLGAAITNLGYCSPWSTSERPPADATPAAWRLDPPAAGATAWTTTPVVLRALAPSPPTVVAALFAPPGGPSDGGLAPDDTWAAGRWVFAVRGTGYERWWAIQIEVPAPPADGAPAGPVDPADAGPGDSP